MNQYTSKAIEWMKTLKYLPKKKEQYEAHVLQMKQTYQQYVEDFTNTVEINILSDIETYSVANSQKDIEEFDAGKRSIVEKYMDYSKYKKNEELHLIVELDAPRTFPQMEEFNKDINEKIHYLFYTNEYRRTKNQPSKLYDVLRRILYIYGSLNPAIGYIQGMNYVLAPLLLIIQNEADCFFCFTIMMSQLKDVFIRTLDHTQNGLLGLASQFDKKLKKKEPKIFEHFQRLGISSQMYCLRWFITCFTYDFPLQHTILIWDEMLHQDYRKFQIKLAVQLIQSMKTELMIADSNVILKLVYNQNQLLTKRLTQILKS